MEIVIFNLLSLPQMESPVKSAEPIMVPQCNYSIHVFLSGQLSDTNKQTDRHSSNLPFLQAKQLS